jgi:hypothetical protein
MSERKTPFATVEEALEEIRQGRKIVLVDDEERENEGDLARASGCSLFVVAAPLAPKPLLTSGP